MITIIDNGTKIPLSDAKCLFKNGRLIVLQLNKGSYQFIDHICNVDLGNEIYEKVKFTSNDQTAKRLSEGYNFEDAIDLSKLIITGLALYYVKKGDKDWSSYVVINKERYGYSGFRTDCFFKLKDRAIGPEIKEDEDE